MKHLRVVCCALTLALGCGKKTENAPSTGSGSAMAGSAMTGSAAAGSGSAAPAPAASDYDTHFKAGEALEDQKKWSEALAEFEAALAAKAGDPRALNEVSFTAIFAGKLDRAQEAAIAAAAAAKDDKKQHAQALFNLGLAVERTQPYAAAQLYMASLADRAHRGVQARLTKLMQTKAAHGESKGALALLAKVNVTPTTGVSAGAAAAAPASSSSGSPEDQALMLALEGAGVDWQSGAGKSVLFVENLECTENQQVKPTTYECASPKLTGKQAADLVGALNGKKIAPVKEHGDVVTYKVASIRCRTFNEGESGAPDVCEITP